VSGKDTMSRNTVRAILYAGGFLHRDRRWFAAPQSEHGGRKLRAALADALVVNRSLIGQLYQCLRLSDDGNRPGY